MAAYAISDAAKAVRAPRSFLSRLEPRESERLHSLLTPVSLRSGAQLEAAGERARFVWFPDTAIASCIVSLRDADSVEAMLVGPEGLIGGAAFFGMPAPLTVTVQHPGTMQRVDAALLRSHLPQFPSLERVIVEYLVRALGDTAQVAACNATHSLGQRTARWLLEMQDRVRRDRFPLTHQFIASMINVRRAGVSQFANELRRAGAIDYTRGEVRVVDRTLLVRNACECYEVVAARHA